MAEMPTREHRRYGGEPLCLGDELRQVDADQFVQTVAVKVPMNRRYRCLSMNERERKMPSTNEDERCSNVVPMDDPLH